MHVWCTCDARVMHMWCTCDAPLCPSPNWKSTTCYSEQAAWTQHTWKNQQTICVHTRRHCENLRTANSSSDKRWEENRCWFSVPGHCTLIFPGTQNCSSMDAIVSKLLESLFDAPPEIISHSFVSCIMVLVYRWYNNCIQIQGWLHVFNVICCNVCINKTYEPQRFVWLFFQRINSKSDCLASILLIIEHVVAHNRADFAVSAQPGVICLERFPDRFHDISK